MAVSRFPAPTWDRAVINLYRPPDELKGDTQARNVALMVGQMGFMKEHRRGLLTGPELTKMLSHPKVTPQAKEHLRRLIPHMSSTRVGSDSAGNND